MINLIPSKMIHRILNIYKAVLLHNSSAFFFGVVTKNTFFFFEIRENNPSVTRELKKFSERPFYINI